MIETRQFEEITQINMSCEIDGKPVYWVAAYLVDGLLIDTGCSYTAHELLHVLEKHKLHSVVNTHFHEDHIGGNDRIITHSRVDIFAHPDSIPFISGGFPLFPYQELVWGYPTPSKVKPIPVSVDTHRFHFQVIETPGHSAGHISLFESSKGWCFSGDIFAREKPKFIRSEEDIGETLRSLKILYNLKTDRLILLTSLGRIVEKGKEALQNCIHYLEDLSQRAKDLQKRGLTVQDIIQEIFGGEHDFAILTNGHYTTENLVHSLLKVF
ncbi:MAG: MBL fold metallo-hydrolase [Deltaproteobacteria bacterium]|nr:MBL fold metallo-hydrolase [Deltaproteobacteria bacterium]